MVCTRKYKWNRTCPGGFNLTCCKEHLQVKGTSIIKAPWITRNAIERYWGLKPAVIAWIYQSILRRRLTYAALVLWNETKYTSARTKLEKLKGIIRTKNYGYQNSFNIMERIETLEQPRSVTLLSYLELVLRAKFEQKKTISEI